MSDTDKIAQHCEQGGQDLSGGLYVSGGKYIRGYARGLADPSSAPALFRLVYMYVQSPPPGAVYIQ